MKHIVTCITFLIIVNHEGYIYIQASLCFNFLGIDKEGWVFSSSVDGTYRTCCTNSPEMYTPSPDSPIISVCMAAKS